ncbi:hypothetical protein O181_069112 [Austropuccinia psidii MF-1]|uniref:Myosin-binding domain-containing protein n=1 Tax=Austropuccinia psidii MF-1 TaxID=1389203 RepID=A0A9Q3F3P3_9BASI|nr:hypothetical protein [Austropuccinia psidii MF-1]
MAEPLIISDSPLDDYLKKSVPNESPTIKFKDSINSKNQIIKSLSLSKIKKLISFKLESFKKFNFNNQQNDLNQQNNLSERLKYLICTSFLLNPNLKPNFYDNHLNLNSTSSSSKSSSSSSSSSTNNSIKLSLSSYYSSSSTLNQILHLCRLQSNSIIIIIILITILILYSWIYIDTLSIYSFLIPLIISSIFLFNHLPHLSSRRTQLKLQSKIIPLTSQLISKTQSLDLRISRAIGAIKEIECVALGLKLSNPLPPISRLESASFPSINSNLDQPSSPSSFKSNSTLHALGLRKVLQRLLDQSRHQYQTATNQLESILIINSSQSDHPISNHQSNLSNLETLMEMYHCSHHSSQDSNHNQLVSNFNQSLHPQNPKRSSGHYKLNSINKSPTSPSNQSNHHLNRLNRSSLQFNPSSQDHHPFTLNHLNRSSIILSPTNYSSLSIGLSSHHKPKLSRPLSFNPSLSKSHFNPPSSSFSTFNQSSPILNSSKVRPQSMSAANFSNLTSNYNSFLPHSPQTQTQTQTHHQSQSNHLDLNHHLHLDDSLELNQHPIQPYSLLSLELAFSKMHLERKRLMCCLLALDFNLFVPTSIQMWHSTLETLIQVINTIDELDIELTNGMSDQFGPGSFQSNPIINQNSKSNSSTPGSSSNHQLDSLQNQIDHHSSNQLSDFGPPNSTSTLKTKRLNDFINQIHQMELGLKTISTKIQICLDELKSDHQTTAQSAINVHDSIRLDLENIAREWDQSRSKLRLVINGEKILIPGRNRLRPHSLDSSEGEISTSSGRDSSIYSSEITTPLRKNTLDNFCFETPDQEIEKINSDQLFENDSLDSAINMNTIRPKSIIPPPGLEEILKGLTEQHQLENHKTQDSHENLEAITIDQPTHSRNQYHKLKSIGNNNHLNHLGRPKSILINFDQNQNSNSNSNSNRLEINTNFPSNPFNDDDGQVKPSIGLVTELKDVLNALKSRKR